MLTDTSFDSKGADTTLTTTEQFLGRLEFVQLSEAEENSCIITLCFIHSCTQVSSMMATIGVVLIFSQWLNKAPWMISWRLRNLQEQSL